MWATLPNPTEVECDFFLLKCDINVGSFRMSDSTYHLVVGDFQEN